MGESKDSPDPNFSIPWENAEYFLDGQRNNSRCDHPFWDKIQSEFISRLDREKHAVGQIWQ
jgi:hypothetical protein